MYKIFGLYLNMYIIDAVLSLLHAITGWNILAGPRMMCAFSVLITAVPVFIYLCLKPRVPLFIIIPGMALVFWSALGAVPLVFLTDSGRTDFIVSAWQVFIAIVQMNAVRKRITFTAGNTLPARAEENESVSPVTANPGDAQSAVRTRYLFTLVTCLFVVPFVFLWYSTFAVSGYATHYTGGFLSFKNDGLYTQSRTYESANSKVMLIGMMHIGEEEFYQTVYDSIPRADYVILMEGVTDTNTVFSDDMGYDEIAQKFGLVSQHTLHKKLIKKSAVPADVDISEIEPRLRNWLKKVLPAFSKTNLAHTIQILQDSQQEMTDAELLTLFRSELLEKRNQRLLSVLDGLIQKQNHRTYIIPWGAMHMYGFVPELLKRGYSEIHREDIRLIKWATLSGSMNQNLPEAVRVR